MTSLLNRRRFIAMGAAVIALGGCSTQAIALRGSNRRRIKDIVIREAIDLDIPISLALAVAHTESNFDPMAESPKGARGVMQIMPATAKGEYDISPDRLWDPRTNIRLGLHFLGRLIRRYQGRIDLALSYYNGGSAVGKIPNARVIPATRKYVRKVQRLQGRYRKRILLGYV